MISFHTLPSRKDLWLQNSNPAVTGAQDKTSTRELSVVPLLSEAVVNPAKFYTGTRKLNGL